MPGEMNDADPLVALFCILFPLALMGVTLMIVVIVERVKEITSFLRFLGKPFHIFNKK